MIKANLCNRLIPLFRFPDGKTPPFAIIVIDKKGHICYYILRDGKNRGGQNEKDF